MIFPEADIWDIDKLVAKLEFLRERKFTDLQRECLEGTLAGHSSSDIASILFQKKGVAIKENTIRNTLSEQINPYIKKLFGFPEYEKINWSRIIILLHKEYKLIRGKAKIRIDLDDLSSYQLEDVIKKINQVLGNYSLTIESIEEGSIVLVVESTQVGLERIQELFRTGELTELLGVPVINVELASANVSVSQSQTLVNLNQWLQGNFAEAVQAGWQMVEDILQPRQLAFMRADVIKRALSINFGGSVTVALVVQITRTTDEEVDVLALVYPTGENINYLPENLKLTVSLAGETEEIQAGSEVNLLRQEMTGLVTGEQFSVQLSLGDMSVTVDFTI